MPEHNELNLLSALKHHEPDLAKIFESRDGATRLIEELAKRLPPDCAGAEDDYRIWDAFGVVYQKQNRVHEALALFWALYEHMLGVQKANQTRLHKGMPLVRIADCYAALGFVAHAKRYLMLTLCEDALREKGRVNPDTTGIYFRLVWGGGLTHAEITRHALAFHELCLKYETLACYPEALLQALGNDWMTEYPAPAEASHYRINTRYLRHLLSNLGTSRGTELERAAEYLMSCMPGCRTNRRSRSASTDYDVVCSIEGFEVDFRSELGRYFVCECKDWEKPANFTAFAKFCRVLDSTKSRFGILFSKNGISGAGHSRDADREQLKVFQDRGIVIVVIGLCELERAASGENFIQILRERYEAVRLDIHQAENTDADAPRKK